MCSRIAAPTIGIVVMVQRRHSTVSPSELEFKLCQNIRSAAQDRKRT